MVIISVFECIKVVAVSQITFYFVFSIYRWCSEHFLRVTVRLYLGTEDHYVGYHCHEELVALYGKELIWHCFVTTNSWKLELALLPNH